MCSRYEFDIPVRNLIERFGLTVLDPVMLENVVRGDVRPTDRAVTLGCDRSVNLLSWGLDVPWQKQPVINARVETVAEKPTFRTLLEQRLLIPASAYYEWRRDGKRKIKTRIAPDGDDLFMFAGLQDGDRFVMLTCAPAPSIEHVHNRMPVILSGDTAAGWINPDIPFADLAPALMPNDGPFALSEPVTRRLEEESAQRSLFD